jgi:hypothetical protein
MTIALDAIYIPSENVVAREIEGELLIIPLVAGIGDLEDELYTLNDTGREIWKRLNGQNSLQMIVDEISEQYSAPKDEISRDVCGLVAELTGRRMLVEFS